MTPYDTRVFIHPQFEPEYQRRPLVLVDVGARGGLKSNWAAARRHLRIFGFEPDKQEFERLTASAGASGATEYFGVALHNKTGTIRLNVARDRGLSSLFEPNRAFLDAFPDAGRFDIVDRREIAADTLDNLLASRSIRDVDFLKVDTQGSERLILEGAADTLASTVTGVEVEVEFAPIYTDQPLFADVDAFLRPLGFHLFDLRPCYWKRSAGRDLGGPRGQVIWADALYLKTLPALRDTVSRLDPADRVGKVLRALSVALLYGYDDYALDIARDASALAPAQRELIERELRGQSSKTSATTELPGRRQIAGALHRLWRIVRQRDKDAWSVSDPDLGNFD